MENINQTRKGIALLIVNKLNGVIQWRGHPEGLPQPEDDSFIDDFV
jgi:hypothetical protein